MAKLVHTNNIDISGGFRLMSNFTLYYIWNLFCGGNLILHLVWYIGTTILCTLRNNFQVNFFTDGSIVSHTTCSRGTVKGQKTRCKVTVWIGHFHHKDFALFRVARDKDIDVFIRTF